MSDGTCIDKNPLQHDGTSQRQRMLDALKPDSVQLHGFSMKDWMHFAYEYAREVNFFGTANDVLPEGDWQNFFVEENRIDELLQSMDRGQATEPHMALFIAFLKLLAISQQQFNDITRRHLDFYYREVLQLKNKPFVADKVFVIFELARNVLEQKVDEGALLDAGKDAAKKALQYATEKSIVVNPALASQFKSIYHQQGRN
ncbi:MAG: phage baseplate protein, partial [Sphingobacteriales bacterium]